MAPEPDADERTEAYSLSSGRRNSLFLKYVILFSSTENVLTFPEIEAEIICIAHKVFLKDIG